MASYRRLLSDLEDFSTDDDNDFDDGDQNGNQKRHGEVELNVRVREDRECKRNWKLYAGIGVMTMVTVGAGFLTLFVTQTLLGSSWAKTDYSKEKESSYWHKVADQELKKTIASINNNGRAKNVIMFIGDGMGPTSVTAGRILDGQNKGKNGEEHRLSFDQFQHTGLCVTYSVDAQITDSAASATAYTAGVKTNQGMLGLNAKASRANCASSKGNEVTSILRWSLDAGKAAGVVTTTTVTHATPGSTYSHIAERNWESDRALTDEAKKNGCKDIAKQLIEDNDDINVVLGGGMNNFLPGLKYSYTPRDTFWWYENVTRGREDNVDLTKLWQEKKKAAKQKYRFVKNRSELNSVDTKQTDYLFGIFSEFSMAYEQDRNKSIEPSLAEMTEKAISVLKNNPNGYFLMVEGGRIDHGHHATQASKALHDVIALSEAVDKAIKITDEADTLILVTADHSHTMMIAGYSDRGAPILGKSTSKRAKDGMPYTTLVYGNGHGYHSPRKNLTGVNIKDDKNHYYEAAVPMDVETHGGEDVAMYARGPQSHLYSGVHENVYIPMLMAYASCVGPYAADEQCAAAANGVDRACQVSVLAMVVLAFIAAIVRPH